MNGMGDWLVLGRVRTCLGVVGGIKLLVVVTSKSWFLLVHSLACEPKYDLLGQIYLNRHHIYAYLPHLLPIISTSTT